MYKKIYDLIMKYDTIVIARHIGADPDALGAQFALKTSILEAFPKKKVFAVGNGSVRFNYFPRLDRMPKITTESLLIVVDTPDKKRVDISDMNCFSACIKIDHHPFIEEFGDIEYIDVNATSASELVMNVIEKTPLVMTRDIASFLFLGIVADTNRFLFNTTHKTFSRIAQLVKKYNLPIEKYYHNLYMRPLVEIRLQGYMAQNLVVTDNGFGYVKISNEVMNEFGVDVGSAGNLINNFNNIEEVLVVATISEDVKNNLIKFNIRSRGPVINTVAEKYNGGGHKFASGARVPTLELADKLLADLDEACALYKKKRGDHDED